MKITLNYSYLRYDVEQLVHKYSYARIDDTEKRYEANLRSEDTNDGDLIRRLIVSAASRLRQTLSCYLDFNTEDATSDLNTEAAIEYNFKASVYADASSLASVMHLLVVRYAISSWCAMQGYGSEAEREIADANRYEADLKESIRRIKPTRPVPTPETNLPPKEDDDEILGE